MLLAVFRFSNIASTSEYNLFFKTSTTVLDEQYPFQISSAIVEGDYASKYQLNSQTASKHPVYRVRKQRIYNRLMLLIKRYAQP